jgi:hypothetical protein
MAKYAVLWDVEGERSSPVGIAIEREADVVVSVPWQYGIPPAISDPYRVLLPDSSEVIYSPDDAAYFDHVLIDLSRSFAIGERGERERADVTTICELLAEKVAKPATEMRRGRYSVTSARETALHGGLGETVVAIGRNEIYRPVEEPARLAVAARAPSHGPYVAA